MPTGTKLVASLAFLALALGVVSWWYRFEAAHRSTEFWGPTAAELIARPSQVTAATLGPVTEASTDGEAETLVVGDEAKRKGRPEPTDGEAETLVVGDEQFILLSVHEVTDVPGMLLLRTSLLTDSNYVWDHEVQSPHWRYSLVFAKDGQETRLLFSKDFTAVGNWEDAKLRAIDCQPMAATLREYFASAKLFDASNHTE